jgi:hypothetical protein
MRKERPLELDGEKVFSPDEAFLTQRQLPVAIS